MKLCFPFPSRLFQDLDFKLNPHLMIQTYKIISTIWLESLRKWLRRTHEAHRFTSSPCFSSRFFWTYSSALDNSLYNVVGIKWASCCKSVHLFPLSNTVVQEWPPYLHCDGFSYFLNYPRIRRDRQAHALLTHWRLELILTHAYWLNWEVGFLILILKKKTKIMFLVISIFH